MCLWTCGIYLNVTVWHELCTIHQARVRIGPSHLQLNVTPHSHVDSFCWGASSCHAAIIRYPANSTLKPSQHVPVWEGWGSPQWPLAITKVRLQVHLWVGRIISYCQSQTRWLTSCWLTSYWFSLITSQSLWQHILTQLTNLKSCFSIWEKYWVFTFSLFCCGVSFSFNP